MQNEYKIYVIILSVAIFEFIEMENLYSGKSEQKDFLVIILGLFNFRSFMN